MRARGNAVLFVSIVAFRRHHLYLNFVTVYAVHYPVGLCDAAAPEAGELQPVRHTPSICISSWAVCSVHSPFSICCFPFIIIWMFSGSSNHVSPDGDGFPARCATLTSTSAGRYMLFLLTVASISFSFLQFADELLLYLYGSLFLCEECAEGFDGFVVCGVCV